MLTNTGNTCSASVTRMATYDSAKPTVGYILSHPFSGSTLLSLMLAAHSEVATVGELVGVNERILRRREPMS